MQFTTIFTLLLASAITVSASCGDNCVGRVGAPGAKLRVRAAEAAAAPVAIAEAAPVVVV